MKIPLMTKCLTVTLLLSLTALAQGQTPTSDEAKIRTLRANIERMIGNTPPVGAAEESGHRQTLQSLRIQLRDLLLEKRGGLKLRIQNLRTPDALPEVLSYAKELERELGDVNIELRGLDRDLGQAAGLPPTPAPIATPPTTTTAPVTAAVPPDPEKIARKQAILAAASTITPEELKSAAAPKEVAENKLPAATCTADGKLAATGATAPTEYDRVLCTLAGNVNDDNNRVAKKIFLAQDSRQVFLILLAKLLKTTGNESFISFINEAQERRIDQQVGAGSSSSGTTSLVSKGGVPYLLGFAVENGAATQSQSDTTITFRVNPAGVLNVFAKKGFITGYRQNENDKFLKFLGKTSLGFTFDTSRGNQPGVFTGDKQQLSAFSARVEFVNQRDPRLLRYEKDWEKFTATAGIELARQIWQTTQAVMSFSVGKGDDPVFTDPALQAWFSQTNDRIAAVSTALDPTQRTNAIAKVIEDQADLLPVKLLSEQTVAALTDFGKQFVGFRNKKNELLNTIAKGKIFTLEYTNNRGVSAPDTSNFNFIAATGTGARVDLTANGSLTFFNKLPVATTTSPRPGRIRDFQFAGQVDIPFKVGDGQFDFWFSGRYERLMENASMMAGTMMPNTKGDIAVGQFGLNIPIKSLGIKFPISLTVANRTELVKEKVVRGNFGFTFNWDTLFSKLKPF